MNRFVSLLILFVLYISPHRVSAGFLEMPEITEMPELERKSMLKDLDIPSVRDRDPDPEAGPRLNVVKFKLQGIVEYPELGITRKEIDRLIEGLRYNLMQEFEVQESGFTAKEIEEVSKMLVEIEEETMERHVSDLEVQKLVWLVREQRLKRGITLGTIETIADRITQFYREKGFILAKAYIPEQQVRGGVVTLTLLLGMLGEVEIYDNKLYKKELISSVFDSYLTLPVKSDYVEENIYLINDYPGLTAIGFFEPGAQVGDTRLNINVKNEKRYAANVRLDNHGAEDTGEQRLYGDVSFNNVFGIADQFHIAALSSFSPDNTTYWQMRYTFNLFHPRWYMSIGQTENQFVLAQNDEEFLSTQQISGETQQSDISIKYKLKRSRVENYNIELLQENILSDLQLGTLQDPVGLLDDEIDNTSLILHYDILQEESKILHQGFVKLVSGEFAEGDDPGQDKKYSILMSDYTLLSFLKLFDVNTRIIMRTSLQYTDSALSSISQFSLGGPTRMRGYPVNQFSADSAVYIGFDWVFNLPSWLDFSFGDNLSLKKLAQPFLFADASHGIRKSLKLDEDDVEATLYDAGFGFRLFYTDKVQGNLQFAFPIKQDFSDPELELEDDSMRVVFDLQYSFR